MIIFDTRDFSKKNMYDNQVKPRYY